MMFLAWFDDNAKRPLAEKIAAGAAAYRARFGTPPTVVLMRDLPVDLVLPDGVTTAVRAAYLQPHMFYFGMEAADAD